MAYSPQVFNKALEQYVFNVTSNVIATVDQETQRMLIDLVDRFTTTSASVNDATDLASSLPLEPVSQTWQQVLSQPINWKSVHKEWLVKWIQQQMQQQKKHITHLEEVLYRTQQRHQVIQDMFVREPYRSNLLRRYESSLNCFQQCLDTAQACRQFNANWLKRLQDR